MQKIFTRFNKNGCPLNVITCYDGDLLPELNEGEVYLEGNYDDKNTIISINEKSQAITLCEKESSAITINATVVKAGDFLKLGNLSNPTTIEITGNHSHFRRVITDGEYEFSLDVPGDYLIKCESGVELPIEFKVTVR